MFPFFNMLGKNICNSSIEISEQLGSHVNAQHQGSCICVCLWDYISGFTLKVQNKDKLPVNLPCYNERTSLRWIYIFQGNMFTSAYGNLLDSIQLRSKRKSMHSIVTFPKLAKSQKGEAW